MHRGMRHVKMRSKRIAGWCILSCLHFPSHSGWGCLWKEFASATGSEGKCASILSIQSFESWFIFCDHTSTSYPSNPCAVLYSWCAHQLGFPLDFAHFVKRGIPRLLHDDCIGVGIFKKNPWLENAAPFRGWYSWFLLSFSISTHWTTNDLKWMGAKKCSETHTTSHWMAQVTAHSGEHRTIS